MYNSVPFRIRPRCWLWDFRAFIRPSGWGLLTKRDRRFGGQLLIAPMSARICSLIS